MGFDQWIEDTLAQAEGIPALGGFAHDLRTAYIIWRDDPVDPQVVHRQANNIDDLRKQGDDLVREFNDSLIALRPHWQSDPGGMAYKYLGPEVTAFQIEHDLEPVRSASNPETGWQLWQGLKDLTALLEYNGAAHHAAGDKLDKIVSLHNQLGDDVRNAVINLGAMVALAFVPGPDLLDIPDAAVEADMVGTTLEAGYEVKTAVEITKDAAEIETTIKASLTIQQLIAAGVAIGTALVGITLLAIVGISHLVGSNGNSATNLGPYNQSDVDKLYQELGEKYKISREDIERLLAEGFTPDEIRALVKAGYSPAKIKILMDAGLTHQQIVDAQKFGFKPDILVAFAKRTAPADFVSIMTDILKDFNYTSPNPDPAIAAQDTAAHRFQAQVARDLLATLLNYEDDQVTTSFDIVTFKALIEVTLQQDGKAGQILEYIRKDTAHKPIFLLAPNYTPTAAAALQQQAMDPANNPDGIPVEVLRDTIDPSTGKVDTALDKLFRALNALGEQHASVGSPAIV